MGCPSVPPVPGAGCLLGPAHTSSVEQIRLVWVKRLFFQGCRCASTATSCVSVCSCNLAVPSSACRVHGVTCMPWDMGWGRWAVLISFFFFSFFFSLGVATHNDIKMRARKCRSHGCCGEGGRWWCRGTTACPRAFRRLAHAVLPWLIPARHQPAAGPGQGERGQPSWCCQPPALAGRGGPPSPLLSPSPQAP